MSHEADSLRRAAEDAAWLIRNLEDRVYQLTTDNQQLKSRLAVVEADFQSCEAELVALEKDAQ